MLKTEPPPESALYCSFYLGKRRFAVPVLLVKEVHAPTSITPIPGAPAAVQGYVNLRGHLHVVLNPRQLLTGQSGTESANGFLLVFKAEAGEAFAIQADRLGDILSIRGDQVDIPPNSSGQPPDEHSQFERLIIGYAKLDDSILTLVEPGELYCLCWTEI